MAYVPVVALGNALAANARMLSSMREPATQPTALEGLCDRAESDSDPRIYLQIQIHDLRDKQGCKEDWSEKKHQEIDNKQYCSYYGESSRLRRGI